MFTKELEELGHRWEIGHPSTLSLATCMKRKNIIFMWETCKARRVHLEFQRSNRTYFVLS